MNIKDNRDKEKTNRDQELKFQLCRERSMVAIGWAIDECVSSLEEYKLKADKLYCGELSYTSARNSLQNMNSGDLVWTQNPVTHEHYLVEITDEIPLITNDLKKFDISGYRNGTFYLVSDAKLTGALSPRSLSARHTIEQIRIDGKRNASFEATKFLFNNLKHNDIKNIGG